MDTGSVLTAIFGAVASCALVHIGFAAFGVEPLLHAAGDALTGATGSAVHSCGLDHVIESAVSTADVPTFEFSGDKLVLD